MLNRDAVEIAKSRLSRAVKDYNSTMESCQARTLELYNLRHKSSEEVIGRVETLINSIADHPKSFDRSFTAFEVAYRQFHGVEQAIERKMASDAITSSAAAGVGVAAGTATAVLGPTAAMAVATTFGTASTGTAIASLSGAAATKAALAWLGGGALAAGGGGATAGSALLALAGPVGWSIAGLAALGGTAYYAYSNGQTAAEAASRTEGVEKEQRVLDHTMAQLGMLFGLTKQHVDGMHTQLSALEGRLPRSYTELSSAQLKAVGALVNHVRSLAVLLNKTVDDFEPMTGAKKESSSTRVQRTREELAAAAAA